MKITIFLGSTNAPFRAWRGGEAFSEEGGGLEVPL